MILNFFFADEPTTALDVTVQAQVLELMKDLKASSETQVLSLITHDMGVVARMCDRVHRHAATAKSLKRGSG